MHDDLQALIRSNETLNAAENAGDLDRLAALVAPQLAFRRRDGSLVASEAFLQAPKPGNRVLSIESVQVFGDRAVVACVVADAGVVTHNLRLWVREGDDWRVLGWANAPG